VAREIFVSYSQPDRECAFELAEHLEANGLAVWIAPRDVSPSADWAEEIIDAISGARVMVLVFSASSNESSQVRREVERAVHKQLRVLPFRIEEVMPARSLEYFLSAQHWLDAFSPPRRAHYARLCTYLRSLLAEGDSAHGATAAPTGGTAGASAAGHPVAAPTPHDPCLPPAQLEQIELHLARLIGPIARILVDRSARNAGNLDQLLDKLTAELDSKEDRHRFLESCKALRHP